MENGLFLQTDKEDNAHDLCVEDASASGELDLSLSTGAEEAGLDDNWDGGNASAAKNLEESL